jgi:SanA protein
MTEADSDAGTGPGPAARGSRRRHRRGAVARFLVVALVGITVLANAGIRVAAHPYLYHRPEDVPSGSGVAIVPGASVHRDGTPSPQVEERLRAALALLKLGRVKVILVSGAHHGAYDEAGPMRRWLLQRGAAAAEVLEDHSGFRTLDTMERAAAVYRVDRAVVCTQAFHLPRAVFLARHAKIDAIGLAADSTPRTTGATDWMREWVASVVAVGDTYVWHRGAREPGPGPTPPPSASASGLAASRASP